MNKCHKCGREDVSLVMHHHRGYLNNNDDVIPLCKSCHQKLHGVVRREGKCPYPPKEVEHMSKKSYNRRNEPKIELKSTVGSNIRLHEVLQYNLKTGNVYVVSGFYSNNGDNLVYINEGDWNA